MRKARQLEKVVLASSSSFVKYNQFKTKYNAANFATQQLNTMNTIINEHIPELDTPVDQLDCQEAFEALTEKERKYLHYFSKVS